MHFLCNESLLRCQGHPFSVWLASHRSSRPDIFLGKGVLKTCSKFTGEHPCRSVLCNFIEIILWHGCSLVNLLHIFRTPILNSLNTKVAIILEPVSWFVLQINWLVSVWLQLWRLMSLRTTLGGCFCRHLT